MKCPECNKEMDIVAIVFDENVIVHTECDKEYIIVKYTYSHCNTITTIKKHYARGLYNCGRKPDFNEYGKLCEDLRTAYIKARSRFRFEDDKA